MLQIILLEGNSSYEGAKSSTSVRFSPEASKRNRIHIPTDLQVDILLRLPVKSLRRFESVCKTWQTRIRSRDFVDVYHRHRRSLPTKSSSLDLHTTRTTKIVSQLSPDMADKIHEMWAYGPLSNGVYCITSKLHHSPKEGFLFHMTSKIALYNPATNDYKLANPLISRHIASHSLFTLGFGCVPLRGLNYKAVVIFYYSDAFLSYVYCFQSGTWKRIHNSLNVEFKVSTPCMVCSQSYFHGCWHWMAISEDGYLSVLSFNFEKEDFKLIGGPILNEHVGEYNGSVCVLHDHLTVIHVFDNYELSDMVSVWVMKEYGVEDSWSRVYTIVPADNSRTDSFFLSGLAGIDSRFENDSISIKKLYFTDLAGRIISCDDEGAQLFCSSDYPSSVVCWNTPGISTYVPSLERFTHTVAEPIDFNNF